MKTANLYEVFVSVQGEGTRVGERHIFVRFQGCDLKCCFCDTPASALSHFDEPLPAFSAQISSGLCTEREQVPNPATTSRLTDLCSHLVVPGHRRQIISLTGGEPLMQTDFLLEWLPGVRHAFRFYLETNGLRADDLRRVVGLLDVISMDVKLPSSTNMRPFWDEHGRFLEAVDGRELIVKVVVTRETSMHDVLTAAKLVATHDEATPFILQPAGGAWAPGIQSLIDFQDAALAILTNVRIIPQVHVLLKLP